MTQAEERPKSSNFNQLIVFDFDWSLVDQDTDRYLFEVLEPNLRKLLNHRKNQLQWTDNVADCLRRLNDGGATKSQIEQAFSTLPLHPAMKRAIEALWNPIELENYQDPKKVLNTKFLILSNSNSIFIELVLKHYNLYHLFEDSIITNPAHWDADHPDRINLKRRVDPNGPQHTCSFGCSPNMCKGAELSGYLEKTQKKFDRIAYVGDGENDFCPIVQLKKGDFALVRKFRGLSKRIEQEKSLGKQLDCAIIEWSGAWEVEQAFLNELSTCFVSSIAFLFFTQSYAFKW
ncbi:hypothetical protein O181_072669 [Austropuccinia psidii MF-1]|uniref:Pyridoxal phosphate phosphatase phospho2 n=1 Tax=Austropuccinia psidii MF-1 TaxID=1389203 RepID=A0A9Q3F5L8_9BASI|nr:hypothetical protein [Austropuccinia psidii MF-1]